MPVKAWEVAARFGVSPKTVLRWWRRGLIPGRKVRHGLKPHVEFDLAEVVVCVERVIALADDVADGTLEAKVLKQIEEGER